MRMFNGQGQQESLPRSPDQVLRLERNLERKFMGLPLPPGRFDIFLTQVLERPFQNRRLNGICHTRLFDPYEINLG